MNRDTLYELRSTLALYPYFQTARLLMLQNLYILHDPSFDEELRRAALYVTDRKVIFQMIEAAHYQLRSQVNSNSKSAAAATENRTVALIDNFLDSLPADEQQPADKPRRKPTPADAAVDYVAYLLESETQSDNDPAPQMKGQSLIDNFLEQEQGRIVLNDLPTPPEPDIAAANNDTGTQDDEYFTETLARIYIKQERYQKALDIIKRLNQQIPEKNAYFTDQIRFLEKLIINNNNKKN